MVDSRFEPRRAVEIVAPQYGSGYRIGGRLVLTAAHLVPPTIGAGCQVRITEGGETRTWPATVTWLAPGWSEQHGPAADAALLELAAEAPDAAQVALGRLPLAGDVLKLRFDLYGWPAWAQTRRPDGSSLAGGRHVDGTIYLADISAENLLVLEPERTSERAGGDGKSQWGGMSGAAVFCGGLVVGVQRQHQNPDRSQSLEAVCIARFAGNAALNSQLARHGIDTAWPAVSADTLGWADRLRLVKADATQLALAEMLFVGYGPDELARMLPPLFSPGLPTSGTADPGVLWIVAQLVAAQIDSPAGLREALAGVRSRRPDRAAQVDVLADAIVATPVPEPPKARTHARVPSLPPHHRPRAECAALATRIAAACPTRVAITGESGIGKTTLACALVRSPELVNAFDGQICWVRGDARGADPLTLQSSLFAQLGGGHFDADNWTAGVDLLAREVQTRFRDQRILVVFDDPPEPLAESLEALDLGDTVTLLVTTSSAAAARDLVGAEWTVQLAGLDPLAALDLLAASATAKQLPGFADRLAQAVGRSPLGLTLLGSIAREMGPSDDVWQLLLDEVGDGGADLDRLPSAAQTRIAAMFDRELTRIPGPHLDALAALALFPGGVELTVDLIAKALAVDDLAAVRLKVTDLQGRSLLRRNEDWYEVPALLRGRIRQTTANLGELARLVLGRIERLPPMIVAVLWRDRQLLGAMFDRLEDLRGRPDVELVPLSHAAIRGWAKGVQDLLRAGADVALATAEGFTALHHAAQNGDVAIVSFLLAAGGDPAAANRYQRTPLDVASRAGNVGAAALLIAQAGRVWSEMTLPLAADRGHTEVIAALLRSGRLSDGGRAPEGGERALLAAAQEGHEPIVDLLLRAGADPNYTESGTNALNLAAQNGHLDVVRRLLSSDVPVDEKIQRGRTAVMAAAQNGHLDIVAALLYAGADPSIRDADGYTAAHLGALSRNAQIAQLVTTADTVGAATSDYGVTPLHVAAAAAATDVAVAVLERGADPDARDRTGYTPLMAAAAVASFKLAQHTQIRLDEQGFSGTFAAAVYETPPVDLLQCLLAAGADVHLVDDSGNAALHHAALSLNVALLPVLLSAGANPATRNAAGYTALDLAHERTSELPENELLNLRIEAIEKILTGHAPLVPPTPNC